jgi:hypothetical protein
MKITFRSDSMKNKWKPWKACFLIFLFLLTSVSMLQAADKPAAPSNLALKIEGKGFLLSWKASPDDPDKVTGYEIARATMASGPFAIVGHTKKGVLKYHDLKVKPENIYFYKVRARAGKEASVYSNAVTGELSGY